jgi:hypothetical protein
MARRMPYTQVKTLHELALIDQQRHLENTKTLADIQSRLESVEDFQKRIRLGQKWLLCAMATLGGLIATTYYLLSSWHLFKTHG